MVCMVSGVLFQGWDVGTLGNTCSGCATQRHLRVDASEASLSDVCVCGTWTHVVCILKAHFPSSPCSIVSRARLSHGVWCETARSAQLFCLHCTLAWSFCRKTYLLFSLDSTLALASMDQLTCLHPDQGADQSAQRYK